MATSFKIHMEEQGIPFYRFNPQLNEDIPSGETDLMKLVQMLIEVGWYFSTVFYSLHFVGRQSVI